MLPPSVDATIPPEATPVNDHDPISLISLSLIMIVPNNTTSVNSVSLVFNLVLLRPTSVEYTRVIASVYVRAKAKRLKAWTREAYAEKGRFMCSQTDVEYRHTDYHINSLERPIILDPNECKNRIRFLNGTDNAELNQFHYNTSFTFFDDPSFQQRLETVQPPFKTEVFNTYTYGIFTYPHILSGSQIQKKRN